MMNDTVARLLMKILDAFLWGGTLSGARHLPQSGPAVFVSNHLGPLGPIGAMCSIPLRLYPWLMDEMLDRQKAAAYLQWDFAERTLKLKPPLSVVFSRLLAKLTVPLLASTGAIPASQSYDAVQGALKLSVDLLLRGKCLLIFPENIQLPEDTTTRMRPFKKGFTRLGELLYAESGHRLPFYPITVHETRTVILGKAVIYNPRLPAAQERLRIKHLLEADIRRTYLEISAQAYQGVIQAD